MPQALPKQLLLSRRQPPEARIILQCTFLLGWRQILIASQPVSRMTARPRAHLGSRHLRGPRLIRSRLTSLPSGMERADERH